MNEIRNQKGQTEAEFLASYDGNKYEKPSITTDIVLFTVDEHEDGKKALKVLLVKRKDHPFINQWALPGGFVQMDEGLIDGAYRELKEETNVAEDIYLEQLYTFGDDVHRDPRMRIISTAYMALTPKENIKKTVAGDDASDAQWFEIMTNYDLLQISFKNEETLILYNEETNTKISYNVKIPFGKEITFKSNKNTPECNLAFDHVKIIWTALDRLKNKVEYTPVAFSLLPNEFTLMELQEIYQLLLRKNIVKQNFRKKMVVMLTETGNIKTDTNYRPAKYYKYNPNWEDDLDA